jgi:hypothetical protein
MRAVRATAEAMRAWPTEIVERECVSVTPSARANVIAGQGCDRTRDRDGTRCFIEHFPANLDIAHSAVVGPDAQRDSRWAGKIRSGRILRHILNGTGPATNPGGSFRRASCQLARSGPRFRSPMKHGTRGQAGSLSYGAGFRRSRHAIPRLARELGCGQNLPAGGHGSPAGRKRIPAGGGDPFSHRGRKDPRQPWGVMSGPSTGRDGTRDWDRTEVAYRLPAKPVGLSEATGTVGQVDPPGQPKVDPPGRVPHI